MNRGYALLVAALTVVSFPASAAVITFESAPTSPVSSYTELGVTFTTVSPTGEFIATGTPNGTLGLLSIDTPRSELRADISGGASFVSIDLGDFAADADTIFLELFNSANVLIGFDTALLSSDFSGMVTLSASAPGVAYAIFGARAPAINGSSVYADNFTWTASAVPEPAALMLIAIGLGMLGFRRRSRSGS